MLADARQFESAKDAVETYREEIGCIDQDLPGILSESMKTIL